MAEPRFTRRALADLESQLDWRRERDPAAGDRLAEDIERTVRLLAEHPMAGRAIDGTSLRVLLTPRLRFRVVYRVRGYVVVVRLLHPRQG